MAKHQSFAEKASKKKKKNQSTYIKYIRSVRSEKTGHWRYNEQMIKVNEGENLDGALKRMDDDAQALTMEMPDNEQATDVDNIENNGTGDSEENGLATKDDGQEGTADVVAEETAKELKKPGGDEGSSPDAGTKELVGANPENESVMDEEQEGVDKTDHVTETADSDQAKEEPMPATDDSATVKNDQESSVTEGDESAIEEENDADVVAQPATEDDPGVAAEQAEDSEESEKDKSVKSGEST